MIPENKLKAFAQLIGTPPPNPPYPHPPLECVVDETGKVLKEWKKEMQEMWVLYRKNVQDWRIIRAKELREYRRLIKE